MFTPEILTAMLSNPDIPFNMDEIEKAVFSSVDREDPLQELAISGFKAGFAVIRKVGESVRKDVDRAMRDNLLLDNVSIPAEEAATMEDTILRSARYAGDQAQRQLFLSFMRGAVSAYEDGLQTS